MANHSHAVEREQDVQRATLGTIQRGFLHLFDGSAHGRMQHRRDLKHVCGGRDVDFIRTLRDDVQAGPVFRDEGSLLYGKE